jgi:hypothetical protein
MNFESVIANGTVIGGTKGKFAPDVPGTDESDFFSHHFSSPFPGA